MDVELRDRVWPRILLEYPSAVYHGERENPAHLLNQLCARSLAGMPHGGRVGETARRRVPRSRTAFDENYTGTRSPAGGERVAAAGDSDSENDRTRASGDRAGTGGASDQSSAGSAACTDM